jgi:transglutaminase/protease-like cytokinesis protein 3
MNKFVLKILFLLIFSISNSQTNPALEMARLMSNTKVEITDLTDFVKKNISDKEEIAKFYYYWINLNIAYDFEKRDKWRTENATDDEINDSENPLIVFEERKAVCSGFSNLYKMFMDSSDIDCIIITGHVKTLENLTLEPELDDNYRHAWNAVKINNSWLLVDTTWAQQFEEIISDFYFNTLPERLILSHYPEDNEWQLMKNPITIKEFNKQPYVHSLYFDVGFGKLPQLTKDEDYYYIEFPKIANNNWLIKLTYNSENRINESVFPEYEEKDNSYLLKFKKKGIPKKAILNVVVTYFDWEKQTKSEYNDIIKYQL